jgi:hypothetical protein
MRPLIVIALALLLIGCTKSEILDFAMRGAPHPAARPSMRVGPYDVLAGDMHCHVLPPDAPWHVSRDLAATEALAREEGLDFVVLTPHVPARFFLDAHERKWVTETQAELRADLATLRTNVVFVPGMEYTTHDWGHVGLAFADVATVLEEVPLASAQLRPELFFERWFAQGGVATLNHPVVRGIKKAKLEELRWDISWRAFGVPGSKPPHAPPDIDWLTHHAQAVETFNLSIAHLRDQFFLHDADYTTRETTLLVERRARADERRIAPVGGSDSHGGWLRPTTWVLATAKTQAAVRDALVNARTCVRGPEACTFELRTPGGGWQTIGGAIPQSPVVEARVRGAATFYVNGVAVASSEDGVAHLRIPAECALVRAVVGASISAPIYVGCPWAR